MKVENEKLIIDEPLENEQLEELLENLNNKNIESITVENPQLDSSIMQAIMCSKVKNIECSDNFLKKIFDNVSYAEEYDN